MPVFWKRFRALCRRLKDDHRGVSILEFGIIAPLLLTLSLGTIDMGRLFYVRQSLEYATETAARYYMLNPTSGSSAITIYLQGQMPAGLGTSVSVSYADTSNCNSNSAVTCTTITATYPFNFVAGMLGLGTKTLKATARAVRYS